MSICPWKHYSQKQHLWDSGIQSLDPYFISKFISAVPIFQQHMHFRGMFLAEASVRCCSSIWPWQLFSNTWYPCDFQKYFSSICISVVFFSIIREMLFLHLSVVIVFQHMAPLGLSKVFQQYLYFSSIFYQYYPWDVVPPSVCGNCFPTHGTLGYPDPLTSETNTLFVAMTLSPSLQN